MSIIETVTLGNATLYLGDCQAIAANLTKPAAIITTPPYGIGFQHGNARNSLSQGAKNNTKTEKIIGDDKPFDPTWMLDKMGTKAPKLSYLVPIITPENCRMARLVTD